MNALEGVSLREIMQDVAAEQLADSRRAVVGYVKNKFQTRDLLQADVAQLEAMLAGKRKQLEQVETEIAKMANEDWSLISLANSKKNKDKDSE